jgi:hypothetical protein
LDQAHTYCQATYFGTVVNKSESGGRSSTYFLQIAFDSIPTQSLVVHPIKYSSYSVGDRFSIKSDFDILFGRGGSVYYPIDPKYHLLNNIAVTVANGTLIFLGGLFLSCYILWGLYILNKKISQHLAKRLYDKKDT